MDDPGLRLLGHLLEASHDLAPDGLVAAVTQAGRARDADDVAIYLVDYEQTLLVPLPDGTDRTPLAIDATWPAGPSLPLRRKRLTAERDSGCGCRCWTAPSAWASSASPSQASTTRCGSGVAGWPPWSPSCS
jgi:hypothetical protein